MTKRKRKQVVGDTDEKILHVRCGTRGNVGKYDFLSCSLGFSTYFSCELGLVCVKTRIFVAAKYLLCIYSYLWFLFFFGKEKMAKKFSDFGRRYIDFGRDDSVCT